MNRDTAKRKAEQLVEKMTVEEMASQLIFNSPAIERLGIPAYNWWNEALHGVARAGTATMFPQAIGMAAAFDEELMLSVGRAIAKEGRAKYNTLSKKGDRDIYKGLTFWSPNINIFRDPRWGRGHETYGEDPYLTSRLGVSFVKGLQGEGEYLTAAACAKHFAAHSGPEEKRHFFDAKVSKKDLEETYLPAFEACVREAGVEAVMGAYNRTNGEPCCASETLINDYLRGKWGFEGHFVSDCWAVLDFHLHHKVTASVEESAALALKTGCDLNCGEAYSHLMDAYEMDLINEGDLKRACVRLFTTRYLLGLFEKTELDDIDYTAIDCPEHRALAHRAAAESVVMLKNNGILPLDKSKIKSIGVIGPNADSRLALMGNYHGTSPEYITVLEGIRRTAGDGICVRYSEGCHLFEPVVESLSKKDAPDRLAEALTVAEYSDVVVLVTGMDETVEGEEGDGGEKTTLDLPEPQLRLMEALLGSGKDVILLNMTGSCVNLTSAAEKAAAVLQCWYPGGRGGLDIAEILFGNVSPSGKLPVTFYSDISSVPDFEDYSMRGRTYRYFEGEPLYPFGFGLTYGDCHALNMDAKADYSGGVFNGMKVTVTVKNSGSVKTRDVLELYVKDNQSPFAVKNYSLSKFMPVELAPGEEKTLSLDIAAHEFTSVNDEGERAVFSSEFTLFAGFSQPDKISERLTNRKCSELKVKI